MRPYLSIGDAIAGFPVGDSVEHMVPRTWLRVISPRFGLERDLLNAVTLPRSMNCARGARMVARDWVPPPYLRGTYARAALYVAAVSDLGAEVVNSRVMRLDTAAEWNEEWPVTPRERERLIYLADAQGRYVLRRDGWREARVDDALLGELSLPMAPRPRRSKRPKA